MKSALTLVAALLLAPLAAPHAADNSSMSDRSCGDRHPAVNCVYPENAFLHAGKGGRLIDVTKPPFLAAGDGKTDDTGALIAALDYVHRRQRAAYCSRDHSQGSYLLYLPNGTYRVSDTVARTLPVRVGAPPYDKYLQYWAMNDRELENQERFPVGKYSNEQNDTIVLLGQSRDGTVIRLDDNCPGFGQGQTKPVLAYFRLQCGSNVNPDNVLENITIDSGRGNLGAVGVRWNASNTGAIRNTTIRSGDGAGVTGLLCDVRNVQGLIENLTVSGFDEGLVLTAGAATAIALEHATFSDQRRRAIRMANTSNLSARKVLVENAPTAVTVERSAHAVILDSDFRYSGGKDAAIELASSHLFVRNLTTAGWAASISVDGKPVVTTCQVEEYVSGPVVSATAAERPPAFAGLPVAETPLVLPESKVENWANVDDFGALGDGVADDTAAIQRAMDSGLPAVLFPRVAYAINGTVRVPKTVGQISFLYGCTVRTQAREAAMFCVAESSPERLLIQQNINVGGILVDHEADRPVVLSDSTTYYPFSFSHPDAAKTMPWKFQPHDPKTNCWRLYRNTRPNDAPKRVFVNNCVGFAPGGPDAMHAVDNVRAWCRQVDTEHYGVDLAFRNSSVWILGFKTEIDGTHFHVAEGSELEVLGGLYYQGGPNTKAPVVIARDSRIRVTMSAFGGDNPSEIILEDQRGEKKTRLGRDRFPLVRPENKTMPVIPLLVN